MTNHNTLTMPQLLTIGGLAGLGALSITGCSGGAQETPASSSTPPATTNIGSNPLGPGVISCREVSGTRVLAPNAIINLGVTDGPSQGRSKFFGTYELIADCNNSVPDTAASGGGTVLVGGDECLVEALVASPYQSSSSPTIPQQSSKRVYVLCSNPREPGTSKARPS